MSERWLAIPGYSGYYEVSSAGRVRSVDRTIMRSSGDFPMRGRVLRQTTHPRGYMQIRLHRDGFSRQCKVHTLVALAFYGQPDGNLEVRHLNDEKSDNRTSNLAWGTRQENMLDRVRNGLDPNANKTSCPQGHPYDAINTRVTVAGWRECRTCTNANSRRYKARRALAVQS